MRDRKLANRLRRGDLEALDELIDIYTVYAKTVAGNILGGFLPEEDIEETVADSFAALWYSREKIEPDKIKAYIGTITRNKAKSRLKSLRVSEPLEDDYPIARAEEPENQALLRELQEITRSAVNSLPEPDREIFLRHYFLYEKTEEISASMGMNSATVRTKLKRGREKLKAALREKGVEDGIYDK